MSHLIELVLKVKKTKIVWLMKVNIIEIVKHILIWIDLAKCLHNKQCFETKSNEASHFKFGLKNKPLHMYGMFIWKPKV